MQRAVCHVEMSKSEKDHYKPKNLDGEAFETPAFSLMTEYKLVYSANRQMKIVIMVFLR
jgi:hypothetical protein